MTKIVIYSKEQCPYCHMAKDLLKSRGLTFEEIRIDLDDSKREEMLRLTNNRRTVPQIFINNTLIGGYDDLSALANSGELDKLIGA